MKKYFLLILPLLLTSCNFIPLFSSSKPQEDKCSEKPPTDLILENAPEVTLTSNLKDIGEGEVSSRITTGYTFQGKSGQKIEYNLKTPGEACLWIITPSNQIFRGKTLQETGIYTIQLAGLKGQRQTYSLSMGLDTTKSSASPPVVESSRTPTPVADSSPTRNRETISQSQAVQLVKDWYSAKNYIFGSKYDESLARKYATGTLLYETIEKCNDGVCGGSVGWLKEYGCYYTYDNSKITEVVSFSSADDSATLVVKIRETLQLHGSKSAGCGSTANNYEKTATYWLKKVEGDWKINQYQVES